MEFLYQYIPVLLCAGLILIPFGMLGVNTYKAIRKTNTIQANDAILSYIPFINYCKIHKLFYGKIGVPACWSLLSVAAIGFRMAISAVRLNGADLDPWLLLVSLWVGWGGFVLWYLLMAFIAFDTARLTRRGIVTKIFAILLPPIGAFVVAKSIRRYFYELNKEATDDFAGKPVRNNN